MMDHHTTTSGPRRGGLIVGLLAITLVGGALRWSFLDHPMRYDESLNYYQFTSRSPGYILTHYNPGNHVVHTLMVRVSTEVFGRTPFGLRFPVFVGGTLLIPISAWLAWTLFASRAVALLTALAVAAGSQLVEYSANARGYVWMTLFATLMMIATWHALRRPRRNRYWLAWGACGALGAYTLPLMVYPVCGLSAAVLLQAVGARGRPADDRRAVVRGWLLGGLLCGCGTLALYAPMLIVQGPRQVWEIQQMTLDVWGPRVGGFGNMLAQVAAAWTRDAHPVWAAMLVVGFVLYGAIIVRERSLARALPLIALAVAVLVIALHGVPLRSRAWMFALPPLIACALAGLLTTWHVARRRRSTPTVFAFAVTIIALLQVDALRTVAAQPYLISESASQVDVEAIVDECRDFGADRYALIMRYTPAANFYRDLKHMPNPLPPADPRVERVYIVVDTEFALADHWHAGIDGYGRFNLPVMHTRFERCTLYRADVRASAEITPPSHDGTK
jgi:4-amino-4-deoxy-L-arabinose transferase-like glycosyltransferase